MNYNRKSFTYYIIDIFIKQSNDIISLSSNDLRKRNNESN